MNTLDTKSPQIDDFLHGKFLKLDIAAINKELRQFWIMAQDNTNTQISTTRACSNNLIILTQEAASEESLSDLIDNIMIYNPCRAILAICAKANEDSFEAYARARCHLVGTGQKKQVCSEQITIKQTYIETDAKKVVDHSFEMASAVSSLILQDMPVIMWWQSDDFNYDYFRPFDYFVDTLIVDTAKICRKNPVGFFQLEKYPNLSTIDLTGVRLLPWRKAIALTLDQFFAQGNIKFTSLRFVMKKAESPASNVFYEAMYLLSWLSEKLKFKLANAKLKNNDLDLLLEEVDHKYTNHNLPVVVTSIDSTDHFDNNINKISIYFEHNNTEKCVDFMVNNNEILVTGDVENSVFKVCDNDTTVLIRELVNLNDSYSYTKFSSSLFNLIKSVREVKNAK